MTETISPIEQTAALEERIEAALDAGHGAPGEPATGLGNVPHETAAPIVEPAVTLFIANVKSSSSISVRGWAGKYRFEWSARHKRLVREYRDAVTFAREELDLRKNTVNPYHICTMMGSLDPVENAQASLEQLIRSKLSVPLDRMREVLAALSARALEAIAQSGQAPERPAEPAPAAVTDPDNARGIALRPRKEEAPSRSPLALTEEALWTMGIDPLKELKTAYGIKARSRQDIINGLVPFLAKP